MRGLCDRISQIQPAYVESQPHIKAKSKKLQLTHMMMMCTSAYLLGPEEDLRRAEPVRGSIYREQQRMYDDI